MSEDRIFAKCAWRLIPLMAAGAMMPRPLLDECERLIRVKRGNDTRGPERPDPRVLPSLQTVAPADVRIPRHLSRQVRCCTAAFRQ
jgi:hypothetical protein